ncbi:MAG: FAD-binding protein [Candidatus Kapaibacteriota bacterium]
MKKQISGWGNFPSVISEISQAYNYKVIQDLISSSKEIIANGLLRSYGDSALLHTSFSCMKLNKLIEFDETKGIIRCQSGVSLADILKIIVPKGWFLPVTPGTKYITIAGAVASDVHGKNHHKDGTFGNFVLQIKLILPNSEIITCSRSENPDIFFAAIGGMGLIGIILEVTFKLKKISSTKIIQKTIKANSLDALFEFFEKYSNYTYSVSWLDTVSKNEKIGRGLLYLGEHSENINNLENTFPTPKLSIPFYFPNFTLNSYTLKTFNTLYYNKEFTEEKNFELHYNNFFYPLDSINNWNRIYGKRGFAQYQFVIPKFNAINIIKNILKIMQEYGQYSFLTVLKQFGKENDFFLSFPMEGYTLAMDFSLNQKSLEMFKIFDKIILENGGRLYLTKDSRMDSHFFKKTYANKLTKFLEIKEKVDPENKFKSLQSIRLDI